MVYLVILFLGTVTGVITTCNVTQD